VQKYSPKFHRTIKLAPAIGDWTTVHQREEQDEIEIHPIRTSNFDSLTKDQLRFLHYLHYQLAEKLCVKFSADMDIKVELHTVLATQMSYQEFLENAKDKVVQADVSLSAGHKINLIFDWDLADMMINRLVGGDGSLGQSDTFTAIETSILKAQVQTLVPEITNAWHAAVPSDVDIDFAVGSYRRNPKISSREAYVQFGFYLIFGQQELRKFVIAYPNTLLRTLVQNFYENEPKKQKKVHFSEKTLQTLKVDACVSLGTASLTMSELRQLCVGDVVVLDTLTTEPLSVQFGVDTLPWLGYPGVSSNNKVSIQLQALNNEVSSTSEKKQVVDRQSPPRKPVETATFVSAGDPPVAHEDTVFAPHPQQSAPAPVAVAGAMLGGVATSASLPESSEEDDFDLVSEDDHHDEEAFDDDEFEIDDDLDYEDDHDDAQVSVPADSFDFSDDKDSEALHEEVHGDADDSEFSWDDLDDEL
jgi:flagellar motor switch protein FliM